MLGSDASHWRSVTERGCEDEVVAASGELFHHGFGFVTFWDVLDALDFDAKFALELQDALLVLVGPALVVRDADVDDSDLQVAVVGAGFGSSRRVGCCVIASATRCERERRNGSKGDALDVPYLHVSLPFCVPQMPVGWLRRVAPPEE